MGLYRWGRWRRAIFAGPIAALVCLGVWPVAGGTASAANSSTAFASKPQAALKSKVPAIALPAIPVVPLTITDGQNAQTLLSNAITLLSVGIDATSLQAAIAATQQKLDQNAVAAQQLSQEAAAADQRAAAARGEAQRAAAGYQNLSGAVKDAALYLYTAGPRSLTVNRAAGDTLAYAAVYADIAIIPNGLFATRRHYAKSERQALAVAKKAQKLADGTAAKAAKALAAEGAEQLRLQTELTSMGGATAAAVATERVSLAAQAGNELLSASALQFAPPVTIPAPLSTTSVALTWAFSELGKSYVWGATGPNTFDCSGLTQYVWHQAGVSTPRVAAAQDTWSIPVPLSELLPGDLVFFGRADIHHEGMYIGDGLMINAPHTGDVVRVSPIWWSDLAGFGREHAPGTPVPLHQAPTVQAPATPVVVPSAGPVPSQTKPPPGWKPKPGSTSPIDLGPGPVGPPSTTTTAPPTSTTTTTSVPTTATTTTNPPPTTTTTTSILGTTTTMPPR